MKVRIIDETRTVEISVPGKYNPDILEDMSNRVERLYSNSVKQELESFASTEEEGAEDSESETADE